eukprot:TRINITY_DN46435_c0_g1_i1.p1 TRINITY_DN46435_c0_g1~~TRINITY_DN46435_c0_g1_i1.p1  ORF type:complete len:468 (-),score=88.44 TRINITY_DN46435_c0_g1_i1:57-1415(-)
MAPLSALEAVRLLLLQFLLLLRLPHFARGIAVVGVGFEEEPPDGDTEPQRTGADESPCIVPWALSVLASSLDSISFGAPSRLFASPEAAAPRMRPVAALLPRPKEMREAERHYTFDDEVAYYKHLRSSLFCLTWRKGGWVAMRHYEILGSGCIPFFANVSAMPPCIGVELPRREILEAMALSPVGLRQLQRLAAHDGEPGTQPFTAFLPVATELRRASEKLQNYAERQLQQRHVAERFLARISPEGQVRRILFLNALERTPYGCFPLRRVRPDYARDSLFTGLVELGLGVVDAPRLHWLYDDFPAHGTGYLYGRGFSYARSLSSSSVDASAASLNVSALRPHWRKLLGARYFDHVVLSTCGYYFPYTWAPFCRGEAEEIPAHLHLDAVFAEMAAAGYGSGDVSFVHGRDQPLLMSFFLQLPAFLREAHIFVREGIKDDVRLRPDGSFRGSGR